MVIANTCRAYHLAMSRSDDIRCAIMHKYDVTIRQLLSAVPSVHDVIELSNDLKKFHVIDLVLWLQLTGKLNSSCIIIPILFVYLMQTNYCDSCVFSSVISVFDYYFFYLLKLLQIFIN